MKRKFGSKSRVGKAAQKITNAVGGKGITDYFGGRGSKRGAVKSAAKVAFNVGTLAAGGAIGGAARAAKAAPRLRTIKKIKVAGQKKRVPVQTAYYSKGKVGKGMSARKRRIQNDAIYKMK